ncbi:MAG: acyltransferase family protein [Woeseiaceae bacterium]
MAQDGAAISAGAHGRRYDVDALRVFAFALLILYHVGMFYVADWGWHVKSSYSSEWLQLPMSMTSQWRMPLIFMISGLAVSFIWGKYSSARFAARRAKRLLIPFLFGMAFVVSPQCYYEALNKGLIDPGFLRFMGQYLTFQDFPGEAWAGEQQIVWTWNHLWYLLYLFFYTLLLIPVARFLDGPGAGIRRRFQSLRGVWLVVMPILPLMLYYNVVFPSFPGISHAFFDDWYAHAMFFTFFLYGFLIARDEGLWRELTRIRKATLLLALVSFGLYMLSGEFLGDESSIWQNQLIGLITYLNRWLWIITVLGWGHHLLNKPMKWLPYATEAVYPWYILHQTIILVVGYNLAQLQLGLFVESLLVLLATIGGCLVLHEFVIRRVGFLRPLFGLK